jgi:hypothetical protein
VLGLVLVTLSSLPQAAMAHTDNSASGASVARIGMDNMKAPLSDGDRQIRQ